MIFIHNLIEWSIKQHSNVVNLNIGLSIFLLEKYSHKKKKKKKKIRDI